MLIPFLPVLLGILLLVAPAQAPDRGRSTRNGPGDFVNYRSRESGGESAPRLVLERQDGTVETFPAVADATLIAYLPDRRFGGIPSLSISLSDTNRVLVRFAPVRGAFRKAEIVLRASRPGDPAESSSPPREPFELGAYDAPGDWDERGVTWDSQPEASERPAATARVEPAAAEVRLDVTAAAARLAAEDAGARGWLLRVVHPLPTDGPEPGTGVALEREILGLVPWAHSVTEAVRQSRDEGKLVLACVRGQSDPTKTTYLEQILIASTLADPDILALIRKRFVPVRVNASPELYTMPAAPPRDTDPLAALGSTLREEKATALVVSDHGRRVASLRNIGTFDRDLVLQFLQGALDRAEGQAPGEGAWDLLKAGRPGDAGPLFERMGGREGQYGLARTASLRGDHETALRLALPLAQTAGPYQIEAAAGAGRAQLRLGRPGEASELLRQAAGVADVKVAAGAGYDLGSALQAAGEGEKARAVWRNVALRSPGSPPAIRAKARLAWPEAMAMYENITSLGPDAASAARRGETEADRSGDEEHAVRAAVDYLLSAQDGNGTWSSASSAIKYRVAITALAARSLHLWSGRLEGKHATRALEASERATDWLKAELGRADSARMDSFGAAYLLDYFLDLEETRAARRGDIPGAVRLLLDGQCAAGGWSYDREFAVQWTKREPQTFPGRTHSMNTGLSLLALARARRLGFAVVEEALDAGKKALLAMREGPGVYTYIYPGPKNFHRPENSAARGPLCEHALAMLGAAHNRDLDDATDLFLEYRAELRLPTKVWGPSWLPPRAYTSYFYLFAYAHAARAIAYRGGARQAVLLDRLGQDLLRVSEVDGTWMDFESIGKPYGTAMALHVLYLARVAQERAAKSR